jgi:hypothetical protein
MAEHHRPCRTGLNGHLTGFYENLVVQQACNFKAASYVSNAAARHEAMSIGCEREEYIACAVWDTNRLRCHLPTPIHPATQRKPRPVPQAVVAPNFLSVLGWRGGFL